MEKKLDFYKVRWDNGSNASGEFYKEFSQWKDADAFGRNWEDVMNVQDPVPVSEEGYTYEVWGYFNDGTAEPIYGGRHDEYVTDEEENYDLDEQLCQILEISMDELDQFSLTEVQRLRKVLKTVTEAWQKTYQKF